MIFFKYLKNYIINDENSAAIVLLYFLVMLALTFLCRKYFWKLVCKSSGRTVEKVAEKKKEILSRVTGSVFGAGRAEFNSFLLSLAPNPAVASLLNSVHSISLLPAFVSVVISFFSLFNSNYKKFAFVLMFVVPVIDIALLISAKIGLKHKFKYVDVKETKAKRNYLLIGVTVIMAFTFFTGGIRIALSGIKLYNEQLEKQTWISADAQVCSEQISDKKYIYTYKYYIDNREYLGQSTYSYKKHDLSHDIKIKINPENKEESTDDFEIKKSILWVNILAGAGFFCVGVLFLFTDRIINRIYRK